jgi:hypothetical protein
MLNDIFFTVFLFESLALQGSEKSYSPKALLVAHPVVIVYQWPPGRHWQ